MVELRTMPWVTGVAQKFFFDTYFPSLDNPRVLEFGCGGSTIYMSKFTDRLITIEHNKEWIDKVNAYLEGQKEKVKHYPVDIRHIPLPYHAVCGEFEDDSFDLVIVDGRGRNECIKHAKRLVKEGGVLMLDNSERAHYKPGKDLMEPWPCVHTSQPTFHTTWWLRP